ncbi:MAG TPA: metal-dependent hydrolase [Acidimicrobiales bacterium]|nr:metal-dependent hydrolase [Acidimicrobiales bacterium]
MASDTAAAATEKRVPTRRMSFEDALAAIPKHFADGDVVLSHYAAVLSGTFPEGEDFFVRSVRHYRDQITDPVLKQEVSGFIGQEAQHGRQHRTFNERLAELGYPTKRIDATVAKVLRKAEKKQDPIENLAVTAALEHFTATMAQLVLTNEAVRAMNGDGPVAKLFLWHALEEAEHKAVAFDVYRAVGGSEKVRIRTMKVVRKGFISGVVVDMIRSIARDPEGRKPKNLLPSLRRFVRSAWCSRELLDALRAYDRPGFHPNDIDDTALVAEWRERLFGTDGELTEHLLTRAAA